jgi:membrane protease YdiL (CAAX protease family)
VYAARRDHSAERTDGWPPEFRGEPGVLLAFGLAFAVLTVATNEAQSRLLADGSRVVDLLGQIPMLILLGGVALLALRAEGVRLRDIGVSRENARRAVLPVAGVVIVVNVVALGLALLAGNDLSLGRYAQYVRVLDASTALVVVVAINNYLFTGPVEELAFRGYLQNKVIELFGGRETRLRPVLAITTTAVLFVSMHLPDPLLDDGLQVGGVAGSLALLAASALLFGAIYELTHNLVLVALLHGVGNWWPLLVDPGPGVWPNYVVVLIVYSAMVWTYRRAGLAGRSAGTGAAAGS